MDQRAIKKINVGDFVTVRLDNGSLYWCKIFAISTTNGILSEYTLYAGYIISGQVTDEIPYDSEIIHFNYSDVLAVYDFDNQVNNCVCVHVLQTPNTEVDELKSRISMLEKNLYSFMRHVYNNEKLNRFTIEPYGYTFV